MDTDDCSYWNEYVLMFESKSALILHDKLSLIIKVEIEKLTNILKEKRKSLGKSDIRIYLPIMIKEMLSNNFIIGNKAVSLDDFVSYKNGKFKIDFKIITLEDHFEREKTII
jgi:hypothetical protein